ncbi:hypothetical protein VPH35_137021 [Triticum aestivum]
MELSSAFKERVQRMEDARNHCMSRLQAKKDIQAAKSRLLASKAATARRLKRRRLLLECHAADLAPVPSPPAPTSTPPHKRHLVVACDISSANGEIEDAQWKAEEWDRFYESKRKEMQEFRAMSQQFEAGARQEVQRLKASIIGLHSDDAGIGTTEARKVGLIVKKAKLDATLAAARPLRAPLRQQLQKAFAS